MMKENRLSVKCLDEKFISFDALTSSRHSNMGAPAFFAKVMKSKEWVGGEINLRLS